MIQTDIPFFNEFKEYCSLCYPDSRASSDYPSRLKKIARDYIAQLPTGDSKTPLEHIGAFLFKKTKNGPKKELIVRLCTILLSKVNEEATRKKEAKEADLNSFRSERSAFQKYISFILEKVSSGSYSKNKITPTEYALLDSIEGNQTILQQDDLIEIFTSRMNTQDRCSGDKTYLPLSLIGHILAKYPIPGQTVKNLRQWSKKEASKVIIHTKSASYAVSNVDLLTIDSSTSEIFITVKDQKLRVYEPAIANLPKEPMKIQRLSQTHIDHIVEIDTILRTGNGNFKGLDVLTGWVNKARVELGVALTTKTYDQIYEHIKNWPDFDNRVPPALVADIIADLDAISKKEELQLTSDKWNQSIKKQANKQTH